MRPASVERHFSPVGPCRVTGNLGTPLRADSAARLTIALIWPTTSASIPFLPTSGTESRPQLFFHGRRARGSGTKKLDDNGKAV